MPGIGVPPGGFGGWRIGDAPGPPLHTPGGSKLEPWDALSHDSTASLEVSKASMRNFLGKPDRGREPNSTFINISLNQRGTINSCYNNWVHSRWLYGGTVTIGYKAKQYKMGEFHSDQSSRYSVAGHGDSGHDGSNRHNYVFINPDRAQGAAQPCLVWQGFFEDNKGAIIIVIDKITGEDGGSTGVAGSVWYKNFTVARSNNWGPAVRGPNPPTPCWFISAGPYDCRAFVEIGQLHITTPGARATSKYKGKYSALYPTRWGYKKLGEFKDLNASAAFGFDDPFAGDDCSRANRLCRIPGRASVHQGSKNRKVASLLKPRKRKKIKTKPFKLPKNRMPLR